MYFLRPTEAHKTKREKYIIHVFFHCRMANTGLGDAHGVPFSRLTTSEKRIREHTFALPPTMSEPFLPTRSSCEFYVSFHKFFYGTSLSYTETISSNHWRMARVVKIKWKLFGV